MVAGVKMVAAGWKYDAVSIGYPGPVLHGRPVAEPPHLGPGWVVFDYPTAFGCPVKLVNDAAMQALGSYRGGKMLFLGLGTGLGSTLIVDGIGESRELGHPPYRDGTFEAYVGLHGLQEHGVTRWRREVDVVVSRLIAALEPEDVVLGGGNVHQLDTLPPGCRAGDNANAFLGGFRLWEPSQDGHIASEEMKGRPMTGTLPLTARPAWKSLVAHHEKIRDLHLRTRGQWQRSRHRSSFHFFRCDVPILRRLPEAKTPEKCVRVVPGSATGRQRVQLVDVAAPENDVLGLERGDQTTDDDVDLTPPSRDPVLLQPVQPDVRLEGSVPVRRVTQLPRFPDAVNDEGRAQAGSQAEKEH